MLFFCPCMRKQQDAKAAIQLLSSTTDDGGADDLYLTLVYRVDGIVNLEYIHLVAQSPEVADKFKKAVNALTFNMLHAHAAPELFFKKQ